MYFKQFYLGCLAHASYLIGSGGEAAVVDPQRDVDQYITEAEANGLRIKYVIETHLHADFVSGHRELAARTGAQIVFGEKARATFEHRGVKDGETFQIGNVSIRALETPGHTPESISLLVTDQESHDAPPKVLTGDTLFIGDVGRPDLVAAKGYSPETMAGMLYDSLQGKLLQLDDRVEVYPAHGAGSMCGRNISKERSSTIGEQRRLNYALRIPSRDEFVRIMTEDLQEAPSYFPIDAEINRTGAPSLSELPRPVALPPAKVKEFSLQGYVTLDVRPAAEFGVAHVPGSINIGLGGQFASWAGTTISLGTPIILVAGDLACIDEAVTRLARVGIESVKGYLGGGMSAWDGTGFLSASVTQMSVEEVNRLTESAGQSQIVDVRETGEFAAGHIRGARNIPLRHLIERVAEIDPYREAIVHCASGYRSSLASSLLKRNGLQHVTNVVGGFNAWKAAGFAYEL